MQRFRHRQDAEAIRTIIETLPLPIQELLRGVDVVTGYDPAWLGLHYFSTADDGRSYAETPHCVYPYHQEHLPRDRRETTVVLFGEHITDAAAVLHEHGHALDERLGFERPEMKPINAYAALNTSEAFAEAFRAWCNDTRDDEYYNRSDLYAIDRDAVRFFDALAEGKR